VESLDNMSIEISSPLSPSCVEQLRCGDTVLISGTVYVARDAAHKKIVAALKNGPNLPFDIAGQSIYYMGPSPERPGHCIGSAGPTTSGRMDVYTPTLLEAGLRAMIGKGPRSKEVRSAIQRHRAVYLAAAGGAGALLSQCILSSEIIAYPELGTEALRRIELKLFPAVVINDIHGGDLYESGRRQFERSQPTP
jgi:fumarate hydratase subunit beta